MAITMNSAKSALVWFTLLKRPHFGSDLIDSMSTPPESIESISFGDINANGTKSL